MCYLLQYLSEYATYPFHLGAVTRIFNFSVLYFFIRFLPRCPDQIACVLKLVKELIWGAMLQ